MSRIELVAKLAIRMTQLSGRSRSAGNLPIVKLPHSGLLDMRTTYQLIALAACTLALAGAVRDASAPVSDAVRSAAARAEKNFIGAAENMPADKYGFKPTAAQMA